MTLTGAVTQPFLKDSAEKAVQRVPRRDLPVNDQIEVLPLSPFDDIESGFQNSAGSCPYAIPVNRYFAGTIRRRSALSSRTVT